MTAGNADERTKTSLKRYFDGLIELAYSGVVVAIESDFQGPQNSLGATKRIRLCRRTT